VECQNLKVVIGIDFPFQILEGRWLIYKYRN
jgi:hypothetical protein